MDELARQLRELTSLDEECAHCMGNGRDWRNDNPLEKCRICDGLGRIPTEFGERVLAFVAARFGLTQKK